MAAPPCASALWGDVCPRTTDAGVVHLKQLVELRPGPRTKYTPAGLDHIVTLLELHVDLTDGGPKHIRTADVKDIALRNPALKGVWIRSCNATGAPAKLAQLTMALAAAGFTAIKQEDMGTTVVLQRP